MAASVARNATRAAHIAANQVGTASRNLNGVREWLIVFPDRPNVLDRRIEIRPRHSPNFVRLHNEGWVSWAGPVFEKHTFPGNPRRPFKGSVMVVNDVGKEQIWDRLKGDPYVKERIWDMEKAMVIPFVTNYRKMPEK